MCQSSGIQETLMQSRYVGCMDEIASAFSNIELMCWNIHHVPKCSVIEAMLERREPSVIGPVALFPRTGLLGWRACEGGMGHAALLTGI